MSVVKKFLVNYLPDLQDCPCTNMEVAYLDFWADITLNQINDNYFLFSKNHRINISSDAYDTLKKIKIGNIITKKRYHFLYNDIIINIDEYQNYFAGLYIAEIEFPTMEDALNCEIPSWLQSLDIDFDNKSLGLYNYKEKQDLLNLSLKKV